jgi:uncharacterized protein DUF6941
VSQNRLGYLILCDGHSKVGGKDCILGIFNRIFVQRFPAQHEQCFLAFELWTTPGKHELKVKILDTDGKDVVPELGPLEMNVSQVGQGSGAIQLRGLPLAKQGIFSFVMVVDGEQIGARDLFVESVPQR